LFSKRPITQLEGKKIALTSSSATSVALLKIILQTFLNVQTEYEVMKPNFYEMMKEHDACLLIGDDAIRMKWEQPGDIYRYDLGELWYQHTGYPMTYAVFAIRNELVEKENELLTTLYHQIIASKNRCIDESFIPMISSIEKSIGGTRTFWERYFAGLHFDFDEKQQEGLHYYYQLAYDLGLLKKKVTSFSIWGQKEQCHFS
ncbi:MAG TPA: menaquinone biosynthesis protein, partial [Massilibacterium sp.]|nr:menaquinone biosynthesis protein [Massilibacterium sp.]